MKTTVIMTVSKMLLLNNEGILGTSLAVQGLGPSSFTTRAWIQSLMTGELGSRKPCGMAKNKKKRKEFLE